MKNKLNLAKNYAIRQHKGQFRKNHKTPYWHHLRDVVNNLEMMGITDESILCAGWLHDVIEDTSFDFDDVSKDFGMYHVKISYFSLYVMHFFFFSKSRIF